MKIILCPTSPTQLTKLSLLIEEENSMDIYIIKDFEFSSFYNSVRWILDIGNKINLKIKVILSMEPKFTEKYEDIKNLSYKKVKKTQFLKSIIYIYF